MSHEACSLFDNLVYPVFDIACEECRDVFGESDVEGFGDVLLVLMNMAVDERDGARTFIESDL